MEDERKRHLKEHIIYIYIYIYTSLLFLLALLAHILAYIYIYIYIYQQPFLVCSQLINRGFNYFFSGRVVRPEKGAYPPSAKGVFAPLVPTLTPSSVLLLKQPPALSPTDRLMDAEGDEHSGYFGGGSFPGTVFAALGLSAGLLVQLDAAVSVCGLGRTS